MSYVFDTSPLSTLFRNYYRNRFPSLWERFDYLVETGEIVSTREVFREVEDGPVASLLEWAKQNRNLFTTPNAAEGVFVGRIYTISHFQQNIEQQKLLKGGNNADPFVIAKAYSENKTVVTMELLKSGASKIPNICHHFSIPCITLEKFMEEENWKF